VTVEPLPVAVEQPTERDSSPESREDAKDEGLG
jgi:hypothetical protein